MKIIGINSSLRCKESAISQHRSFTCELLKRGLDFLEEKYKKDVEVEIINLGDYNISFEEGAYSSNENFALMLHPVQSDDMNILYGKMIEAHGVIFSSPTYWGYPSALLKSFIERLTVMDEISDDKDKRRLQGKVAGAISTAKFDGSSRVAQDILSMANYLGFIIPPHAFAFHTGRMTTSVLEDDEEFEENYFATRNAQAVAENVYLMAKLVSKTEWRIFQEFTHPLSEDEKNGVFDLKKEKQACEINGFYREYNKKKGLV